MALGSTRYQRPDGDQDLMQRSVRQAFFATD